MNGDGEMATGGAATIRLPGGEDPTDVVNLTGQVHQLPCCIKYDGHTSVSDYFKPKPTGIEVDGGLKVEEAYFRGRKLQGANITLPHGYSGFVIGKKSVGKGKCSNKAEKTSGDWETKAKFDNLTFWNHDNLPSQDDIFLRSFHWLTVANALHKPVTAEEIQAISITKQPQD